MRVGRLELHPHRTGLSRSGDTLTLSGTVEPANPDWRAVAVSREQILGMDGQLVGVSWPHDGRVDGFWRIVAARVEARNLIGTRARMEWQLGLAHTVNGPVDFESALVGDTLANAHGLTGGTPWLATPAGVEGMRADPYPTAYSRASADGQVRAWVPAPAHATWSVSPADFYRGAATIRQNLAVVTGRGVVDPPGIFELSNAMLRVRWIVGEVVWDQLDGTWDDMGDLTWDDLGGLDGVEVALWNGTGWDPRGWNLGITPQRVAVLRNDPHACSVRLEQDVGEAPGARTLDLTLRRGSRVVHGHMRGPVETRTVLRTTAEEGEQIDGGVKSAVADEGRYVAASAQANDLNLAQGGFTREGDRLTFMVGATRATSAGNNPESLVDQWISHVDEDVTAVRR